MLKIVQVTEGVGVEDLVLVVLDDVLGLFISNLLDPVEEVLTLLLLALELSVLDVKVINEPGVLSLQFWQ